MSTPTLPDTRLLRRSRTDRKIAGVCGGLGEWSNIDPVVYRISMVVLAIFGGIGLLAYGLLWLVLPLQDETDSSGQRLIAGRPEPSVLWPILLVIVGLTAAGGSWARFGPGSSGLLVVAALVVTAVLIQRSREPHDTRPPSGGAAMSSSSSSGPPSAASGSSHDTATGAGPYPGATSDTTSDTAQQPSIDYGASAYPPSTVPTGTAQPPAAQPREPRSILGGLTVSVALIAAGVVVSWGYLTGNHASLRMVLSVALAVVAAGLLVGTFLGRSRGLVVLGVLLSLVVLTAGMRGVTVAGGIGDKLWRPASLAAASSPYELSVGNATLDLTGLSLGSEPLRVQARLGVGDLVILVPTGAQVQLLAHVGTGSVAVPGAQYGGMGVDRSITLSPVGPPTGQIIIDAQVGIGELEVRRA